MTVDELVLKVNDGWGWATVDLSRNGKSGQWAAFFQCVQVYEGEIEVEQEFIRADLASDALRKLVLWLRGKTVRHRAVAGGVYGGRVSVPIDLEFQEVS